MLSRTLSAGALVAAMLAAGSLHPSAASAADGASSGCRLGDIAQIVYIQFDNVHFRRDNPNVPSDLEQMPNLLSFMRDQGTLLVNHHTPLISHTSVDILTALSGLYGDRMGVPVGNSFRYFNPDGSTSNATSFAYWTDVVATISGPATDQTPQMIGQDGKIAPALWAAFTRAGCDVGAFSIANMELENLDVDIVPVFGAGSDEANEVSTNRTKAQADFLGIAVHCAKGSPLCATGKPDILKDEPGGYVV